jgi:hypothetical protein
MGTVQKDCVKAECGWDMENCGYCDAGCKGYVGSVSQLQDGVCQAACNTQLCDFDGGDCFDETRLYEVYVSSSAGDGLRVPG